MATKIPLITLEEHFVSKTITDYYVSQGQEQVIPEKVMDIMSKLLELGPKRLASMNNGKVSIQVISHRPNTLAIPPEICTATNNELYDAIQNSPDPTRFAAFAMLPTAYPDAAAKELKRCVEDLHFVGSLIDNTTNDKYYDDEFFWPIFAAHEQLGVPVYLHGAPHVLDQSSAYHGNYPPAVSDFLANFGFGWHSEVALHVLKLFASGLFDKHPRLKLILGHMGEHLPYTLERQHRLIQKTWPAATRPQRHLLQVWHENIYVTTSGMFSMAPMSCLIHMCCADKVLYSVDYPFCSNQEGLRFISALRESGMINDEDFASIAYKNAERLLGLRVPDSNKIGLEMGKDETRLRPWLSEDSANGDPFPHSPLDTVRE
ncbi:hypothetical protein LTR84_000319 [Exophiala bonariae]|uniref:Amidohydrolase-related domain-containing protein n=1 Tax=Exophiala bonariae TaxID=1690606 RepID=A0AAV9NRB4_9EURO|nr:hypothetical protein LTR84_000319 [Exophiala bonariae]